MVDIGFGGNSAPSVNQQTVLSNGGTAAQSGVVSTRSDQVVAAAEQPSSTNVGDGDSFRRTPQQGEFINTVPKFESQELGGLKARIDFDSTERNTAYIEFLSIETEQVLNKVAQSNIVNFIREQNA